MQYIPSLGEWRDEKTGKVLKLNCGDNADAVAVLVAIAAFNPDSAQSVYANLLKIVGGVK